MASFFFPLTWYLSHHSASENSSIINIPRLSKDSTLMTVFIELYQLTIHYSHSVISKATDKRIVWAENSNQNLSSEWPLEKAVHLKILPQSTEVMWLTKQESGAKGGGEMMTVFHAFPWQGPFGWKSQCIIWRDSWKIHRESQGTGCVCEINTETQMKSFNEMNVIW